MFCETVLCLPADTVDERPLIGSVQKRLLSLSAFVLRSYVAMGTDLQSSVYLRCVIKQRAQAEEDTPPKVNTR